VGANAARTNLHEQGDQIEGFFFTPIGWLLIGQLFKLQK
jgi:hypothetical protein